MKQFMDQDFLLSTDSAKSLYHTYAKNMPIVDYHCHINPQEIFLSSLVTRSITGVIWNFRDTLAIPAI